LDDEIIPERHIEPFAVAGDQAVGQSQDVSPRLQPPAPPGGEPAATLWLQASPELHMKRLLAQGLTAIYQTTRSFRRGEHGPLHRPEFTIVEWYRVGDDMAAGIELLDQLCQAVADAPPATRTTYAEAFARHVQVDPHRASCAELAAAAARLGIAVPDDLPRDDRDEWLNLLLALHVEPNLGIHGPEIIHDYPASQAALATTAVRPGGVEVAERFELYWRGVELANGYHELADAAVLRQRLEKTNAARAADGRIALPMPERLLAAMEYPGLPPCAGCALGFDRLSMLGCGAPSIADVLLPAPPAVDRGSM
ncbi:MAG TPA: EF-P lysine aminoacylase GenX, partial [Lacipirellulaceae bacterium]|nr:EF-P lysine aminoacylase GenX [Lacipirellulaceae bacterium]